MTSDLPALSKASSSQGIAQQLTWLACTDETKFAEYRAKRWVKREELLWALRDTYKRSTSEGAAWSIQVLCGHFGFDFKKDIEDYNG